MQRKSLTFLADYWDAAFLRNSRSTYHTSYGFKILSFHYIATVIIVYISSDEHNLTQGQKEVTLKSLYIRHCVQKDFLLMDNYASIKMYVQDALNNAAFHLFTVINAYCTV